VRPGLDTHRDAFIDLKVGNAERHQLLAGRD
jgi:hypothetical protein